MDGLVDQSLKLSAGATTGHKVFSDRVTLLVLPARR
jgi:hypothetical protein